MPKKWKWSINHTLDSKKYFLHEDGRVGLATAKNSGEVLLHIYRFGIEFEWQRKAEYWWSKKCDIFLKPGEDIELPVVRFTIPIDIEPGTYKYRIGVRTESWDETIEQKWIDHGIMWVTKEFEIEIVYHPDRKYQIFISHSNHKEDKQMVKSLDTLLANNGISCFIAEEIPKYGEILWKKIKSGIISADRVIILWTKHGAKSEDVREELGITVGARKRFIPIIEKKVKPKGSLIGTEHASLDRDNYKDVFVSLAKELIEFSEEKAKRTKKVKPEEEIPF